MSKAYELMYVLQPNLSEGQNEEIDQAIQDLIARDGRIDAVDIWGVRPMAYEVQNFKDGYYVVVQFHANADCLANLDRYLKLNDRIMRYLVTNIEDR